MHKNYMFMSLLLVSSMNFSMLKKTLPVAAIRPTEKLAGQLKALMARYHFQCKNVCKGDENCLPGGWVRSKNQAILSFHKEVEMQWPDGIVMKCILLHPRYGDFKKFAVRFQAGDKINDDEWMARFEMLGTTKKGMMMDVEGFLEFCTLLERSFEELF